MSVFRPACANVVRASGRHYQRLVGTVCPAAVQATVRLSTRTTASISTTVFQPRKFFSTNNTETTVQFEDIQKLINDNKGYYLIDIREPHELAEGSIPTSRNIPLSRFMYAWSLAPEDFEEEFGFEKPTKDSKVILYCYAGTRSTMASELLREIGYTRVLNYLGSWLDYTKRSKQ